MKTCIIVNHEFNNNIFALNANGAVAQTNDNSLPQQVQTLVMLISGDQIHSRSSVIMQSFYHDLILYNN